ncbi:MAG: hypothetical protein KatS3mg089_0605 [Patescibacteria group bacterium]|nr:MAG: hypothetical protein KatS3mg089_0605 [Patescibacteria group bacterium]
MKDNDKTFLKIGIIGAFIASLCCLGPLILIALGVGTAGSVLSIGYNKQYFLAGSLLFFIAATLLYLRKRQREICECGDGSGKIDNKKIGVQVLISLCAMILLYLLLTFLLVPLLAPLVYKYLY